MNNNWSEFYNQTEDMHKTVKQSEQTKPNRIELSVKDFKNYWDRLSGELPNSKTKAVISYQTFNAKPNPSDIDDPQSEIIYNVTKAKAEISFDELHPELAVVSIKFKSFDDPELRLLWARIQKWRTQMSKPADEDTIPVFLLHLLERESIGDLEGNFTILSAEIVNPLLCYITREVPTMQAADIINEKEEHTGGNVIKMLCQAEFITFSLRDDLDTTAIKAEVQREIEEKRYINSAAQD